MKGIASLHTDDDVFWAKGNTPLKCNHDFTAS